MLNFLKAKKKEFTITLDRENGIYYPGETVGITVEVQPDKAMKVRDGTIKVSGEERYEYTTTSTTPDENGNYGSTSAWGYDVFFTREESFLEEGVLPGGVSQRYIFQATLPPDALPSCSGKIVAIVWRASVKVDRPASRDFYTEVELSVPALAPGQSQPGDYGESNTPDEAGLSLGLPGLEVVAGQSFSGRLNILPHKDFTAKVRLELARLENVPFDQGRTREASLSFDVAGSTAFTAGQPRAIPFQITIPPDIFPSFRTPNSSMTWTLKGILSRGLHKDVAVSQVVTVYTAKA